MIGSDKKSSIAAIHYAICRMSAIRRPTWQSWLLLSGVLFLWDGHPVFAGQCFTDGPRYQLESDTVEWRMTIADDESCVRGVRFSYVYDAEVSLDSPPSYGQVTLVGSGFTFTPQSGYHGEDSFVIEVSGFKKKIKGFSRIRFVVSVVGREHSRGQAFAHFEPN